MYERTPEPTVFTDHAEWLAARDTFVGGSESAALMGMSPWGNAWKVYGQKTGLVPPMEDTQKLRLGRRMEHVLAEEYLFMTGGTGRRLENTLYRHKDLPCMGASPDFLRTDIERGAEFKNVGSFAMDGWGEEGSDQVPDYYLIQCQHYMEVLDVDQWDLVPLMAGQEAKIYTIPRNRDLGASLRRVIEAFWEEHMIKGIPPPIDASDTAKLYIEKKFPRTTSPLRLAEAHEARWLADLKDVRDGLKRLEEREKELRNLLTASIGDAEGLTSEYGSVTWKERAGRTSIDWEGLVADQFPHVGPAIIQAFTKTAPSTRIFLPNFKKGVK